MWRSLALSIHGDVNAFYGHVPTCEEIWGSALCEAEKTGNIFFALLASAKVIVAQKRLGWLRQAARTFEEQTRRAIEDGYTQMSVAGALYAVYGDILLEWNRVEEAIEHIQRGLNLSERQNYAAGVAWSCISTIQAHFSEGDLIKVEAALRQLEMRIQKNTLPVWTMNWFTAWQVRLSILGGSLDEAGRVLQNRGISLDGEFAYPNEVEYLALARLLIARGDFLAAESLLTRLHAHLNTKGWVDKIIEVQILQALIYQEQGDEDEALALLADLLPMTEAEGYTRVYLNEGPPMAQLLYKELAANITPEYTSRLLAAFPTCETKSPSLNAQAGLVEPLSPRELEVLAQLSEGFTNQEVALALHIALGTVKNHVKNIYSKLNVHSRTQAVARARDLGLLD
jgi:LuxR family maltose regulon positive regulatory protein